MKFLNIYTAVVALALAVTVNASVGTFVDSDLQKEIEGSYIIKLRDGNEPRRFFGDGNDLAGVADKRIRHIYTQNKFQGFSGKFSKEEIARRIHASSTLSQSKFSPFLLNRTAHQAGVCLVSHKSIVICLRRTTIQITLARVLMFGLLILVFRPPTVISKAALLWSRTMSPANPTLISTVMVPTLLAPSAPRPMV
jgi:hypothetical protein